MVSQETAILLYAAHREIEAGEKLLADMAELQKWEPDKYAPTLKDAFGRQRHLQLGIRSPSVLLGALMHDAHEAYTADLSSPMKQVLGDAWADTEHRIQHSVQRRFEDAE